MRAWAKAKRAKQRVSWESAVTVHAWNVSGSSASGRLRERTARRAGDLGRESANESLQARECLVVSLSVRRSGNPGKQQEQKEDSSARCGARTPQRIGTRLQPHSETRTDAPVLRCSRRMSRV